VKHNHIRIIEYNKLVKMQNEHFYETHNTWADNVGILCKPACCRTEKCRIFLQKNTL